MTIQGLMGKYPREFVPGRHPGRRLRAVDQSLETRPGPVEELDGLEACVGELENELGQLEEEISGTTDTNAKVKQLEDNTKSFRQILHHTQANDSQQRQVAVAEHVQAVFELLLPFKRTHATVKLPYSNWKEPRHHFPVTLGPGNLTDSVASLRCGQSPLPPQAIAPYTNKAKQAMLSATELYHESPLELSIPDSRTRVEFEQALDMLGKVSVGHPISARDAREMGPIQGPTDTFILCSSPEARDILRNGPPNLPMLIIDDESKQAAFNH
ncbi:uncharacterized protein NECHADRAFT_88710 [Fusarium vanettenii 77-13-4]|uniref:Uncharacterized protein n=1 Tax=Fusarium vanettenii (strain ATCC MYA-4622 / CBS 123669 / FGSC 9596 / NRRL 45880 / 77-13-4) TaxID=660122 RepID=C7ZNC9_FUSV7|nr:uncharacterized protein NECHADRAFT_88710 [Fusarium vanettenii 77-13-4]EEU34478.1 predicted protein [Fusarium vanettenii 77-13-4]